MIKRYTIKRNVKETPFYMNGGWCGNIYEALLYHYPEEAFASLREMNKENDSKTFGYHVIELETKYKKVLFSVVDVKQGGGGGLMA